MTDPEGQTLVEAIHQKYDDDDDDQETQIHIHIAASAPGKKDSGHISVPPILALHDSNITSSGNLQKLQALCKPVEELDLTKNSISNWEQIFDIVETLPKLRFLNLTSNQIINNPAFKCEKQFPNITSLILNNTGVSWDCLVNLFQVFPSVSELHLSLNGYTLVDLPTRFRYPALTKLYLNNNNLKDWSSLCKVGQCFPNLENLVAMETDITSLLSDIDLQEAFPCLQSLNLSNVNLSTWEDIEVFRQFPVLVDIRIKDIPFLEAMPEKEKRQNIVARLPNITKLNGSPIYELEKEEAERAYIRQFMDQEVKPERYYELEEIHGKLKHLADINLSPDEYIRMKVKFNEKEEYMELDKDQTVQELKKMLQNFCGLPAGQIHLYEYKPDYKDYSLINSEKRALHSYRWTEIDEIHIYAKNEAAPPQAKIDYITKKVNFRN